MRRTTSLFMGMPKARMICCAIRGHPQVGFRCFMSTTAAMTSGLGPFGPGLVGPLDEKSRRYFRCVSARWRFNSVDGLNTIDERINRPGRMKSAHRPATTRSQGRRLGDRFRERLRISSWCLTSTDSATTDRAPPGPASRATVASRCRNRTARSRTAESYQDRDFVKNAHESCNSPSTVEIPLYILAPSSLRVRLPLFGVPPNETLVRSIRAPRWSGSRFVLRLISSLSVGPGADRSRVDVNL